MAKIIKNRTKYLLILLSILLLGFLLWYYQPVGLPDYKVGSTSVIMTYWYTTNSGTALSTRVPKTDEEAEKLLALAESVQYHKKLFQPSSVKSYAEPTGEFQIIINRAKPDGGYESYILWVGSMGTIRIHPFSSRHEAEYNVGFFGKSGEKALYEQIYRFYRNTLTSKDWKSGEVVSQ